MSDSKSPWIDQTSLLRSAERLANVGSWQWDIRANRIEWSPQLYAILGYDLDVVPTQDLWFSRIYAEDLHRLKGSGRFKLSEGPPPPIEFRIRRPSGEMRTVRMLTEGLVGEGNEVTYMRGVIMDVSSERQMELELRHSHKMRAIGRLAGGVAHDFNNLLTVLRAHTERLTRLVDKTAHGADLDRVRAAESLGAMNRAIDLAAQMTARLLNFGRRDPERPQKLDINSSLEAAVTLVRRVIGDGIEIRLDLAKTLPQVILDEGQLHQAIMNLAANARDAMPNGGELLIQTSLSLTNTVNHTGNATHWEGVQITVTDSGMGMTEEVQARALDPFFTTKNPGEGTGLGLSSVYVFTTESGGRMEMVSAPGQGTQVNLHFPAALVSDTEVAPSSERRFTIPKRKLKLCVVEDNEDVLKPLVVQLREAGHEVSAHRGADTALDVMQQLPAPHFDALLTDLMMAKMTGIELVQRVRAHRPHLPVVMMTGYSGQDTLPSDARTLLLRKPFSASLLLDALAQVTESA